MITKMLTLLAINAASATMPQQIETPQTPPLHRNALGARIQRGTVYPVIYGLPAPMKQRDMEDLFWLIQPDEASRVLMELAFKDYEAIEQQTYLQFAQPIWDRAGELGSIGEIGADPAVADAYAQMYKALQPRAFQRLVAVEKRLFDDWRVFLPPDKHVLLGRAWNWRSRVRCPLPDERFPGSKMDLYTLLADLAREGFDLAPEVPVEWLAVLETYDLEASALGSLRHKTRMRMVTEIVPAAARRIHSTGQHREELLSLIESINRANVNAEGRAVNLVHQTVDRLAEILAPATFAELRDRVNRRMAPVVYPDPTTPSPMFVLAIDSTEIPDAMRASLIDLRNTLERRHEELCKNMVRRYQTWRTYLSIHSKIDEEFERYSAEMLKLHSLRIENAKTVIALLHSTLPEDAWHAMEPAALAFRAKFEEFAMRPDPSIQRGNPVSPRAALREKQR